VPVAAYPDLSATLGQYASRKLDLADAALVWLSEETGIRKILTVDHGDFSLFRLGGGKRFELIGWY
jgi:predicted nucleic acid-binding protein